jgi:hypothetical protein
VLIIFTPKSKIIKHFQPQISASLRASFTSAASKLNLKIPLHYVMLLFDFIIKPFQANQGLRVSEG